MRVNPQNFFLITILNFIFSASSSFAANPVPTKGPCPFDEINLTYLGTAKEQARCLLRPVLKYAHIGIAVEILPEPINSLVGQKVSISKEQFESYLSRKKIDANDIGGSVYKSLSKANENNPSSPTARYFVIHDTSEPYYQDQRFENGLIFPSNINTPEWSGNDLSLWVNRKAHLFLNRVGESYQVRDFEVPWGSTKYEVKRPDSKLKGLYLHIELVQPRSRDPQGGAKNDAIAPKPGFSELQLRRLSLVYINASLRAGHWLIPAFHSVIDNSIPGAHDDPQNFDLTSWAKEIDSLISEINSTF